MDNHSATTRHIFQLLLLLLVASFLFFYGNGSVPLTDPDEPVYSETAREMFVHHDFVSPRIYNEYWYDKPALFYWLTATSFKVFGVNEMAARFPSALMGLAGVFVLYLAGRKLFDARTGLWAGFVAAASVEYFYLAKAGVTDMTLTLFLTLALLGFYLRRYYLFWLCMGLATLTKGPIGIFFPVVIVGLYIVLGRHGQRLREMKLLSGVALLLVVTAPWYAIMYHLHGMDFVNTFIGFHNITRFTQPEHTQGAVWWYYLPVLIVGFFPWTGFLPQVIAYGVKTRDSSQRDALFYCLLWVVVVFLFFSVSQTKLVSYIAPLYPALALLTASWFSSQWHDRPRLSLYVGLAVTTLIGLVLAVGTYLVVRQQLPHLGTVVLPFSVALIAGLVVSWVMLFKRNIAGMMSSLVVVSLLFLFFLMKNIFPAAQDYVSVRSMAEDYRQYVESGALVLVEKFDRPGFMFYTHEPGRVLQTPEQIHDYVALNQPFYWLTKPQQFELLDTEVQHRFVLIAQRPARLLVLYQPPK